MASRTRCEHRVIEHLSLLGFYALDFGVHNLHIMNTGAAVASVDASCAIRHLQFVGARFAISEVFIFWFRVICSAVVAEPIMVPMAAPFETTKLYLSLVSNLLVSNYGTRGLIIIRKELYKPTANNHRFKT